MLYKHFINKGIVGSFYIKVFKVKIIIKKSVTRKNQRIIRFAYNLRNTSEKKTYDSHRKILSRAQIN